MVPSVIDLSFWKTPSRKLYAINSRQKKRSLPPLVSDDSDDDFIYPRSVKKGKGNKNMAKKVDEIHGMLKDIMTVNKDTPLPLGLQKVLHDTFKCSICQQTVRPPVIITKCCRSLLGCSECVNTWYSGEDALTKQCPRCRAERGYNETMVLLGQESFLDVVQKLEGRAEGENI